MTPKKIAGLKIRTTNENAQAQKEIPALWGQFMQLPPLPERLSDAIYVLYFDYEKDHTKPYSCLIGYEVDASASIPPELASHTIPSDHYQIFETKGPLPQSVIELWRHIWQTPLNRSYRTDFEVYSPGSPFALIHISIKDF